MPAQYVRGHGNVECVQSDNGSECTSKSFTDICNRRRVPRAPTGGLAAPPDPERDPPAETRLAAQGKEAAMTASRP